MLLRDRATGSDVLRGAFHAHLLLHCLDTARSAASAEAAPTGAGPASAEADVIDTAKFDARSSNQLVSSTASATAGVVFREPNKPAAGQILSSSPAAQQADSPKSKQEHQLALGGGVGADMLRSIRMQADAACAEYLTACTGLGWDLGQTMLNPHEPRLVDYVL